MFLEQIAPPKLELVESLKLEKLRINPVSARSKIDPLPNVEDLKLLIFIASIFEASAYMNPPYTS